MKIKFEYLFKGLKSKDSKSATNKISANRYGALSLVLFVILGLNSCGSSNTTRIQEFDEKTAPHSRIAILPFQSTINLKEKEKESLSDDEFKNLNLKQSLSSQEELESYLIGENLVVTIQSSNMTNILLKEANIDIDNIKDVKMTDLASILNVDALLMGRIETDKPMSDNLATMVDVAKKLEKSILGSFFTNSINTTTNTGHCRISVFNGKNGDRLWSYSNSLELEKGSTTKDIISKLMRESIHDFPYKK